MRNVAHAQDKNHGGFGGGGWKLEVGSWKLEVGGWKLEVGGWKSKEVRMMNNDLDFRSFSPCLLCGALCSLVKMGS